MAPSETWTSPSFVAGNMIREQNREREETGERTAFVFLFTRLCKASFVRCEPFTTCSGSTLLRGQQVFSLLQVKRQLQRMKPKANLSSDQFISVKD